VGSLLFKRIGPRLFFTTVVTAWGIVATFQGQKLVKQPCSLISMITFPVAPGFVATYAGLVTVRAFLGLVEGPLVPGITLILSSFYTRKELAFRYVAGLLFWR